MNLDYSKIANINIKWSLVERNLKRNPLMETMSQQTLLVFKV